jgi:SnoaL-like domain
MTGSTPGVNGHNIDAQAVDAQAVTQLVLRERQSRDRGWWDDMASCFTPDAVINMSWFTGLASEFMRLTRKRSANGVWGRHRLSPPAVQVNGDRAWAELALGIEFRTTIDSVEADLVSYCRSQYRAERRDSAWRIAQITSIYERDTLTPATPGTALRLDPAELAAFRPTYRCLAWYFNQAGTPLGGDLLGDDRPGEVAQHYETERAWLLARLASSRAMAAKPLPPTHSLAGPS